MHHAAEIGIWGTGLAGGMIYNSLQRLGMPVAFFADNNKEKVGTFFYGKEVKDLESISKDACIIIAANVKYGIHHQLDQASVNHYLYVDPAYLHCYKPDRANEVEETLEPNEEKIDKVYDMLADAASKKVYRNILLHRAVHDLGLVWEVYDENQYFGNGIVKRVAGSFVDCGAFQGDTLVRFLAQVGDNPYRYFAFEADKNNYELLQEYCTQHGLSHVKPINLGVWDKKTQLVFEMDQVTGEVAGRVVEKPQEGNGAKISVNSLDQVLGGQHIDFIKMDIEGAEIRALHGAEGIIRTSRPDLAICAYHELEHLWEIPIFMKEADSNYKIYFDIICGICQIRYAMD